MHLPVVTTVDLINLFIAAVAAAYMLIEDDHDHDHDHDHDGNGCIINTLA